MVSRLRLMFLLAVLMPQAVMFFMTHGSALATNRHFSEVQACFLAVALLLGLFLPGIAAEWAVGKKLYRMRQLCSRVKRGDYRELLPVPNESSEGDAVDPVLALMRDMNWMARHIQIREQDITRMIDDLRQSREAVRAQNQFLTNVNEELLAAQAELQERTAELEAACRQMETMAMTDPLTAIANRRCFFEHLERHFAARICRCKPISLMILDIDRFKTINDTYGHQAGDRILMRLAEVIRESSRDKDLPARVGGEEYALLLPDTDSQGAIAVARRIQSKLAVSQFALDSREPATVVSITVSIGVCTMVTLPCWDRDKLYSYADQALYYSKNNGRNSISFYNPDTESIAEVRLN